jgi:capsular exopolysaccharide synthesis family protein
MIVNKQDRYIIKDREQSSVAESFRALSASMQEAQAESGLKTVLFSTASSGEGDTMTAVNAAVTLAHAGKRVILVDCDMRHPLLHEIFNLNVFGVTNIILQDKPFSELLQDSGIENLKVLTCGSIPAAPVGLLSSPKLRELFEALKTMADFIFIVSAPLIVKTRTIVSDACIVASKVDGVVLVIDSRTVKTQVAKKAVELLKGARANLIGTVLNDVKVDAEFIYHAS